MRVVGTAGHVDHGKSTLVNALTGINPDRLQEEQDRQMTIDLGFAWMRLPGGEEIGIVDVPGHRDFIDNMLAGVGGVDAAILVVAADEGIMPQTGEHVAILDLLGIRYGVVALTKIDLLDDPGWEALVTQDVRNLLEPTGLADAPIIAVSARTGAGLSDLVRHLEAVLGKGRPRADRQRPRLPVDRVFSMAGFGTIVTGTLVDGNFTVGGEVEILPAGRRARIRGLQTHKTKVDLAVPGSRVAANLTGVGVDDIARGDVVVMPDTLRPSRLVDMRVKLVSELSAELRHNQEVRLHTGTAKVMGRVRLLGADAIGAGEQGWIQIVLHDPVVVERGDRCVLRRPSPGATLGGGEIVDAHPLRLHRRQDPRVLAALESNAAGSPAERLRQTLQARGILRPLEASGAAGLNPVEMEQAIGDLTSDGTLVRLQESSGGGPGEGLLVDRATWQGWMDQATATLAEYHARYPLRLGISREELRSRIRFQSPGYSALIESATRAGVLARGGAGVRLATHVPRLDRRQEAAVGELMGRFAMSPSTPPSLRKCAELLGDDVLGFLLEQKKLIQVSDEVVFDRATYDSAVAQIRDWLKGDARISVAEVRDRLKTSRKFALALLEHLDSIGVTKRYGDTRGAGSAGEDRA